MKHAGDMRSLQRVTVYGLRIRAEAVGEFLRAAKLNPGRRELSALLFHATSLRRRAEQALSDYAEHTGGRNARPMD